jgi:hypothetical protein
MRVKGQIETIGDKLDAHRTRLLEDVERLERLYQATLEWFHALGDHIAAGDAVLKRTNEETIPALEKHVAENPQDDRAPQRLRDLRGARDELERRVHDLRLTRQVAMQALPSIRLIQENDKALSAKIHSVLANTVPLWRQQLAVALAVHRMRGAAGTVKQATDLTNGLLTANAETLRRGNLEARTELERGVFDWTRAEGECRAGRDHRGQPAHRRRGARPAGRAAEELEKLEADIRRVLTQATPYNAPQKRPPLRRMRRRRRPARCARAPPASNAAAHGRNDMDTPTPPRLWAWPSATLDHTPRWARRRGRTGTSASSATLSAGRIQTDASAGCFQQHDPAARRAGGGRTGPAPPARSAPRRWRAAHRTATPGCWSSTPMR